MRTEFRGHSIILEPSNTAPHTLTVSGKKFGTLVLLVVPPDTDPVAAHTTVMTAADPYDVSSAEDMPPALIFRVFTRREWVVGSQQCDIGCLSESGNCYRAVQTTMEITTKIQDMEVCDGRRRAH